MQDKTAAVRSLAEQLLGDLTARALVSRQVHDPSPLPLPPSASYNIVFPFGQC